MLRIHESRQNMVRKDILRLATVNVSVLSERRKEVVDMFKRRSVEPHVYKKLGIGCEVTRVYGGEEK